MQNVKIKIMEEIWKDITGYEEFYKVSNLGNIFSISRNKLLKITLSDKGYPKVKLYKTNTNVKEFFNHRLVVQHFLENFNPNLQVNHKDGDRTNNIITNLELVTCKENIQHAFRVLKRKGSNLGLKGDKSPHSIKITQYSIDNKFIKDWDCARDVERVLFIANTNVLCCAKGKRKTAGGFIWKYKS